MTTISNGDIKVDTKNDDDIVGLDKDKIPAMQSAIDNYIKQIEEKCKFGAKKSVIAAAIKGSNSEAAIKKELDTMDNNLESLVKELATFKTKLDKIAENYKANDAKNTTFNTQAK